MGFIQRYLAYVQDNPEGYWFKRKLFGWGWTPVTWQGYAVTLIFLAFIVWRTIVFEAAAAVGEPNMGMVVWFVAQVVVAAVLLIVIAWRTGEAPAWQWGIPKKEETP